MVYGVRWYNQTLYTQMVVGRGWGDTAGVGADANTGVGVPCSLFLVVSLITSDWTLGCSRELGLVLG